MEDLEVGLHRWKVNMKVYCRKIRTGLDSGGSLTGVGAHDYGASDSVRSDEFLRQLPGCHFLRRTVLHEVSLVRQAFKNTGKTIFRRSSLCEDEMPLSNSRRLSHASITTATGVKETLLYIYV